MIAGAPVGFPLSCFEYRNHLMPPDPSSASFATGIAANGAAHCHCRAGHAGGIRGVVFGISGQTALAALQDHVVLRGELESQQFCWQKPRPGCWPTSFCNATVRHRTRTLLRSSSSDLPAQMTACGGSAAINDYRRKATVYIRHDVPITPICNGGRGPAANLAVRLGAADHQPVSRQFHEHAGTAVDQPCAVCRLERRGPAGHRYLCLRNGLALDAAENPQRKPFWTGVYFDEGAKKWMVSHVTPADDQGRWGCSAGHDIVIDDLLPRTLISSWPAPTT